MNQFRQSLEELFNKEEMKQKIKDVEEYYNKGVEDSRNNSIMNELIGIRSAYADDTALNQQPLESQSEVNNTAESSNRNIHVLSQNDRKYYELLRDVLTLRPAKNNLIDKNSYPMNSYLFDRVLDALYAYSTKKRMDEVGSNLVQEFGPNSAKDIDNYYHPLVQCMLAQKGPDSGDFGLWMGYGKEGYDIAKKALTSLGRVSKGNMSMSDDKFLKK